MAESVIATTATEKYSLTISRDGAPIRVFGRVASVFIAEDDSIALAIVPGDYSFGDVIANRGVTGPVWTIDVELKSIGRTLPASFLGVQRWEITRLAPKGCGCGGRKALPAGEWA